MLTTATHDHKRGEDVRARLAVLSEIPDEWAAALARWHEAAGPLRADDAPNAGDESILFQTLVGAWPIGLDPADADGCKAFAERVAGWQEKALREAKLATDWSAPNEPYEGAAHALLTGVMTGPDAALRTDIHAFAKRIGPAGASNGLVQTLLRLTVPGVPDSYQGTEFWDLSLVDPDNRRPVDYPARETALEKAESALDASAHWRDGAVKQALMAATLADRARRPKLYAEGAYLPLKVEGPDANDVLAFARTLDGDAAIVVALLRPTRTLVPGALQPVAELLQRNSIALPQNLAALQTTDIVSGRTIKLKPLIELKEILPSPVALLASRN